VSEPDLRRRSPRRGGGVDGSVWRSLKSEPDLGMKKVSLGKRGHFRFSDLFGRGGKDWSSLVSLVEREEGSVVGRTLKKALDREFPHGQTSVTGLRPNHQKQ
jgi:hypothetical protein